IDGGARLRGGHHQAHPLLALRRPGGAGRGARRAHVPHSPLDSARAAALPARPSHMLVSTLAASLRSAVRTGTPRLVISSAFEAFCSFIETEPSIYRFLVRSALDTPNPVTSHLVDRKR